MLKNYMKTLSVLFSKDSFLKKQKADNPPELLDSDIATILFFNS